MAKDVITRFKLETAQYDSKLKDAARKLSDFGKTAKSAGSDFDRFTRGEVAAARALGNIATSSSNAKDRARELVGAFNDVARSYNRLTDAQKRSDFGKAMSDSLSKLQGRIREAKNDMQSLGNSAGGMFGGGKLSGMLQVFGGNVMTKISGAALRLVNELGDAVTQGIELAKQGEGIRVAFERLGRGDILQGLREATHGTVTDLELMKAAVKFNDFKLPVEELGTMLAFAQQKAKDTGQSVDYMVDSIVTGLGRKSLMILDNLGLSANEIKERMKQTGDMTTAVGAIIRDQMAKAGGYVETAADRAAQANVSMQNKMEELGRKFAPLQEASSQFWNSMKIGILDIVGGPLARLLNGLTEAGRAMNAFDSMGGSGEVRKRLSALRGSNYKNARYNADLRGYDSEITRLQTMIDNGGKMPGAPAGTSRDVRWLSGQLGAYKRMRDEYVLGAREILNPGKPAPPSPPYIPSPAEGGKNVTAAPVAGSIDAQTAKVQALQKAWRAAADDDSREKYRKQIEEAEFALDILMGKTSGLPAMSYGIGSLAGSRGGGISGVPEIATNKGDWKLDEKAMRGLSDQIAKANMKTTASLTKEVGSIAGGISGIFGGIESLGVELPEGLKNVLGGIEGVVTILSSIAAIVTAIEALTAADTIIPFARGGVVRAAGGTVIPGNFPSGDNIRMPILGGGMAALNSGELILNKAETNAIASQLSGAASMGDYVLVSEIAGEDIRIALRRNSMRRRKGEYVTTKR